MDPKALETLIKESPAVQAAMKQVMAQHFASSDGSFPIILTTPGLEVRSIPYARPLPASISAVIASFGAVQARNPVDVLLSDSVTGPGVMSIGLPGAPGPASTADRYCLYNAVLIDASIDDNTPPQPFTMNLAGAFDTGEAYVVPPIEFGWADKPGRNEQIIIMTAEETNQGPRNRPARLTTADFPSQWSNNGAPNAAAGDLLTINVTAAPATMNFNGTIVTAGYTLYDVLMMMMLIAGAGGGRAAPSEVVNLGALRTRYARKGG